MIIAYADESGTHDKTGKLPGAGEVVIGGYVANREDWEQFCPKWQAVLTKYNAPYFHFSEWSSAEAIARKKRKETGSFKKNPYYGWDKNKLDAFLIELANIAGSENLIKIGGCANTGAFHLAKIKGDIPIGSDPYENCLNWFFSEYVGTVQARWPQLAEPISIFFDQTQNPDWRRMIERAYYSYRKQDSRLEEITYAEKTKMLPLQAADMLAYRYHHIAGKFFNQDSSVRWPELDHALFRPEYAYLEAHYEEMFKAFIAGKLCLVSRIYG